MVTHRAGAEMSRRHISRVLVATLLLVLLYGTHRALADPVFVESSASANIDFVHNYALQVEHRRKFGQGAAAADYDNDGSVDLYIANGWGYANRLYHNNGDGTFLDVTDQVGADLALLGRESKGVLFLDYDGDGRLDLFVLNDGDAYDPQLEDPPDTLQHQLFRNLGNGQFEDATVSAQIPTYPYRLFWGSTYGQVGSAAAGDLNGDGYPEIYVSFWGDEDTLLLNNGDGTFTDVSVSAGITTYNKDSWTPILWDFNADGFLDIHVCADFAVDQLFINQGDLSFVDQASAAGLDIGNQEEMGAALGDYDNDGDLDLYLTNVEGPPSIIDTDAPATHWNRFMRNDSTPGMMSFSDIGGPDVDFVRTGWGWGVTFVDYNHDGRLDLAVVNGHPPPIDSVYITDQSHLFRNDGPDGNGDWQFPDVSDAAGFNDTRIAKSLIALDFDRDGDQDLFVTNYLESALLYENVGGAEQGNWLVVDPIGDAPNTPAIGATVYLVAGGMNQMRFITAGTSYLSQEPSLAHFGVGSATTVDSIRVVWADGTEDTATNVPSNQYIDFIQGVGIPLGDAISLAITGPSTITEEAIIVYTVTAEYENDVSIDVTAEATWTVTVGGEYAEFDDGNSGILTTLTLDPLEQAEVTIQATFESLSGTYDVTIVELSVDVVGPTVAITEPTSEPALTTEESTVTISGTAEDASGVMAVAWSTDQGGSGPCTGLVTWTTGPIPLAEGVNLITITARDGLQNAASVDLSVTYTIPIPLPPTDPDPPVDPDPPIDSEPPVDLDPTDPTPETPDETPDAEPDDDPTQGDIVIDPVPGEGNDRPATPSTGLCGGMGLIGWPLAVAGLCALRRRVERVS